MNTDITTYDFNDNIVRVIDIDGQPWFVASDVCRAIGYAVKSNGSVNTTHSLRILDTDEVNTPPMSVGKGGGRAAKIISESAVYKLVMRSDKPEAREFQNWVTKVVLPAIRKDGGYVMGEEKVATGEMSEDELIIRAMQMQQAKVDRLRAELAAESQKRVEAEGERDTVFGTLAQANKTIAAIVRRFPGVNTNRTKQDLAGLGYLYRTETESSYRVYRRYSHLFEEKWNEYTGFSKITVTEEGIALLTKLYYAGKLTMKVGLVAASARLTTETQETQI